MPRFNLNDRPVPSGSMERRLAPKIGNTQLNAKLGPRLPNPLVREGSVMVDSPGRRGRIGLSSRFDK